MAETTNVGAEFAKWYRSMLDGLEAEAIKIEVPNETTELWQIIAGQAVQMEKMLSLIEVLMEQMMRPTVATGDPLAHFPPDLLEALNAPGGCFTRNIDGSWHISAPRDRP